MEQCPRWMRMVLGKTLPNIALIRARIWHGYIFQFSLGYCYCAATFEHGRFLCKIYWEFRMMFISSVKMAFSTNFISASCVKLNKFNFVIFFKKVTEFILIMFTVTFRGEWISHSIKECIPNWQVTGLSGLNGDKMFGFCLWGNKKARRWS